MRKLVFRSLVLLYFYAAFVHSARKDINIEDIQRLYNEVRADDGSKKMAVAFHKKLLKSVNCEAACNKENFIDRGIIWDSTDVKSRERCLKNCKGKVLSIDSLKGKISSERLSFFKF